METYWLNDIPSVGWPVLVSPQRVDFLADKMFELVGFWMDIFCVDQSTDALAPSMLSQPDTEWLKKFSIISEEGGIQRCCAKAIGDVNV